MSIGSLWSVKPEFRLKVGLLALTFAFLTATQAVWRSLKVSLFVKIVGIHHVPSAKIYSMLLLIPVILFYSKLVDVLRRHQLMYVFTITHSIGGFIFAYLLLNPATGIANTMPSADRWIGWGLYFFLESFSAFLSTSFWSFANSINKPKDARNYYGHFVAGSKLGGILAASGMWLFMMIGLGKLGWVTRYFTPYTTCISETILLTTLLSTGALFLLGASICIFILMKYVPGYHMHGYEAVYQAEKKRDRIHEPFSLYKWLKQSIDGLIVIISHSYVLGIFCLSLFYDVVMTIIEFYVMTTADEANDTAGKVVIFYAAYFLTMHICGFIISMCFTTPFQRIFSNRTMQLMFPALCMGCVVAVFLYPSAETLFIVAALLRGANYGLNHPIREMLYIPTTKEIKFKSKAWTDAFGTRMAKGGASLFYKNVCTYTPAFSHLLTNGLMFSVTAVWLIVSYFLGRTFQHALDKQLIIGETAEDAAAHAEDAGDR
jgi:AAA family ATP:ADP antiporter